MAAAFKKGLFVFEQNDKNFDNNIKRFLSQRIEIIEDMYLQKEKDRESLIDRFFTGYHKGAGKRTANKLFKEYFKS